MKLILNCSILFGKFFPDFMFPLLHKGYCVEFIVFWERFTGAGNSMKATARWAGFGSRQGFHGHDRVFWFCLMTRGPLYRDMDFRLHAITMSRHSPSMSRQCFASLW